MRWDFLRFTKPKPRERKPRAAKRYRTAGVRCELGTVLDISECGLRLSVDGKCPIKVGDILALNVRDFAHQATLRGCVVWVKQGANASSTCGIAFIDVRPGTKEIIEQIAGVSEALTRDKQAKDAAEAAKVATNGKNAIPPPEAQASAQPKSKGVRASIEIEDLYGLFALSPAATPDEINQAYRSMARNLHPDRNPLPDAAERFSQISKAYKILRDPELRARYDEMRGRAA